MDLIESAPRPKSILRYRFEAALRHPTGAVAVLVVGLLIGSSAGLALAYNNPRTLAGLGYFWAPYPEEAQELKLQPFEQTYGRPQPPILTQAEVAGIEQGVTGEFSVLSARSSIPVLCGIPIGQPGTPTILDLHYSSTVFRLSDSALTQLVWPLADETSASAALHTLALQAQMCPDEPLFLTTIVTTGVLEGLGDEYAVFSRQPTLAATAEPFFATTVLTRVGADLIEIALTSTAAPVPDAQARCMRLAEAAVAKALGG